MKLRIWTCLIALLLAAGLGGCNTIEGMGKDIEAAGDSIENAASKHKGY